MKTSTPIRWTALGASLSLLLATSQAAPLGTAITYKGHLNDGSQAANGLYDFQVALYDDATNGNKIGPTIILLELGVTNGAFTLPLDFGPDAFNGDARWLENSVRTNGEASYTRLSPRQAIGQIPYALHATAASTATSVPASALTGTVPDAYLSPNVALLNARQVFTGSNRFASKVVATNSANQFGGTFTGDGASLLNLNAASLTGTIPEASIGAGSINSSMLAAGAVTTAALADGAVTGAKTYTPMITELEVALEDPRPAQPNDGYGVSVAAVGSDRMMVGAFRYGEWEAQGAAYLFSADGTLLQTFDNPEPGIPTGFGQSLAVLDANRVLIGTHSSGIETGGAYLFNLAGTLLTTFTNPTPDDLDTFGRAVAVLDNDRVVIGAERDDTVAPEAGAAYLFSTDGALLTTFSNPVMPPPLAGSNYFGSVVATIGGDKVLISAGPYHWLGTGTGKVYLFDAMGPLLTTFSNPVPAPVDRFGCSLAAVGTDRLLIGDSAGGVAHLFHIGGALLTTFTSPVPGGGGDFGGSVAAVGTDRVLIGASGAPDGGVTYLFNTDGTLLTTFTNPTPTTGDRFGVSVAASGNGAVLIGEMGFSSPGAAYRFTFDSYTPGLVADGVRNGAVTTDRLAKGAVTAAKIGGVLLPSQIPDLDAAKVTTGMLPDARLSPNVALRDASQTFTGHNQFSGLVTATNPANQFVGAFTGNGQNLAGLWSLNGNAGTTAGAHFLGTTDNQAVEIHANSARALRIEPQPGGPNLVGGHEDNTVSGDAFGVTIAGGSNNQSSGGLTFIGGGSGNSVAAEGSVIGGGQGNSSAGINSFIGGGHENTTRGRNSFVGGGAGNAINTPEDANFIGGGSGNLLEAGSHAAIVGGQDNWLELGLWSVIGGGEGNGIYRGRHSVIAGGAGNSLWWDADWGFIGSGRGNGLQHTEFCAIAGGDGSRIGDWILVHGAVIGGGSGNVISTDYDTMWDSVIGGGAGNVVRASRCTIAGGLANQIAPPEEAGYSPPYATASTIGGGSANLVLSGQCTIAGGSQNQIATNAGHVAIGGGLGNVVLAGASGATIAGGTQAAAHNPGQQAYASGQFQEAGDAQTSLYVVRAAITNQANWMTNELFLDGASQRMRLWTNTTWTFEVLIAGRSSSGDGAGFRLQGVIENQGGTVQFIGPIESAMTAKTEGVLAGAVALATADDENDALVIRVATPPDVSVRWVGTVRNTEVRY